MWKDFILPKVIIVLCLTEPQSSLHHCMVAYYTGHRYRVDKGFLPIIFCKVDSLCYKKHLWSDLQDTDKYKNYVNACICTDVSSTPLNFVIKVRLFGSLTYRTRSVINVWNGIRGVLRRPPTAKRHFRIESGGLLRWSLWRYAPVPVHDGCSIIYNK